uniref:Uncharacterized protein n=1 Tax=Oryza sativa subsp. japonica TaxID=39947 RepID=Q652Y7_ORYSJ|nr:hypothetical protein [Oryza sativa Japonica Group]BAD54201.1 hypothetical protein [Oryza sativa Japonica Group]
MAYSSKKQMATVVEGSARQRCTWNTSDATMAVAAEDASRAASAAETGKTDGESEDLGAAHRQGIAVDISYQ